MGDFLRELCSLVGQRLNLDMDKVISMIGAITTVISWIIQLLVKKLISAAKTKVKDSVDRFTNGLSGAIEQLAKKIEKLIKMIIKAFKTIIKHAKSVIQTIKDIFFTFHFSWIPWGIVAVVIILILLSLFLSRFGSFKGEIVIDLDKMQEMNQVENEYTDLLNTSALKEAFYQSVSDTSFYQTFNLDDMDGAKAEFSVSEVLLGALAASLSGEKYEVTAEGILASGKCTTPGTPSCVYSNGNLLELFTYNGIYVPQLDNRYNITDANRNPAKYLIQAESLGSYSDSLGLYQLVAFKRNPRRAWTWFGGW